MDTLVAFGHFGDLHHPKVSKMLTRGGGYYTELHYFTLHFWLFLKPFLVLENQPATRKKSDVQGFMIDSGPELSSEHDRLSWTRFRFGQLSLIGANWTLISVFPNSLIF